MIVKWDKNFKNEIEFIQMANNGDNNDGDNDVRADVSINEN